MPRRCGTGGISATALPPSRGAARSSTGVARSNGGYARRNLKMLMRILGFAVRNGYAHTFPVSESCYSKPDASPVPGTSADGKYYAQTEEIWYLYDAIDEDFRIAVVLGAYFGLRV